MDNQNVTVSVLNVSKFLSISRNLEMAPAKFVFYCSKIDLLHHSAFPKVFYLVFVMDFSYCCNLVSVSMSSLDFHIMEFTFIMHSVNSKKTTKLKITKSSLLIFLSIKKMNTNSLLCQVFLWVLTCIKIKSL